MRPLTALALFFSLALLAGSAQAQGAIPSEVLQDQFGKDGRIEAGRGKAHILVASDQRESTKDFSEWSKALASLAPSHGIQALANLKALPFFFLPHDLIASSLRKDLPGLPVPLDWKGRVSAALAVPPNATTVLVYSPSGRLLGQVQGSASPGLVEEVRRLALRAQTSP